MDKDTKELVKTLIEGFSNSINNNINKLTTTFATKDDLKQVEKRIDQVEDRLSKAMKEQTDRILDVLKKYEALTEKHDRILGNIKDSFDKEK